MVVPPFFKMGYDTHFRLFGHDIRQDVITDEEGIELGHKFYHIMDDLEDDFCCDDEECCCTDKDVDDSVKVEQA